MDYRYHILTTVLFRHTYFVNNSYTGFIVEPDAATAHHFKRLSLLFKPQPNGFSVLYETGPGLERTREAVLQEGLILGFRIINNDPDLLSYTEGLPENITQAVVHLRNAVKETVAGEEAVMHEAAFISANDVLYNQAPDADNKHNREFFSKPFGWLELTLHEALAQTLYVNFRGKETLWRYIISSEHLQDLTDPAVIHKDTKEAFTGPIWVTLPDGKQRMAFESTKQIPLCSKPEKVFQLVENYKPETGKYKVVLGILPNPNVKLISLIGSEDTKQKNIFSEIFI